MKKLCPALLAVILALTLAACGGAANTSIEGSVEELLSQVAEGTTDPEVALVTAQATDETFEWYFFIAPIEGAEGWVSEPAIGSIPHFIGLLRVPEAAGPEQAREEIEENLNPRKWVCTEAEKTAVIRRENLILVVMSDSDTVSKAIANFNALGN